MADSSSQIEKSISFFINQQFPAIYREDGPELVQLAKDYYKFLESETNQSIYVSRRFFEYKDIDTTIKSLLIFFQKKYLADLELKESIVPFLVKNILDLYRRKGTPAGIELFFATFYNEYDIEIVYPSSKMLKLSNSEWKTGSYLQMYPNDNLFYSKTDKEYTYSDLISKVITGSISEAMASVTRINSTLINGIMTPIIYIDNVQGQFQKFDDIYTNINGEIVVFGRLNGSLSGFEIDQNLERQPLNEIGDLVNVKSSRGVGGEALVVGLNNDTREFVEYTIENGGWGYTVANTNLIVSDQAIITDPTNTYEFEPYERLRDTAGNEGFVVGQSTRAIGVKMTNLVTQVNGEYVGFEQTRAISTLDRSPNIDLKLLGIQRNVSVRNDSSPGILYPEGNPPDANTHVIAELTNVQTIPLITDQILPYVNVNLNAADYGAATPMSGTASPVTINTPLDEAFDVRDVEMGTISYFRNIDKGDDYSFEVFARARDNLVNLYEKKNQIIRLTNAADASIFNIGETITEQGTSTTGQILSKNIAFGLLTIQPNSWYGFTGVDDIVRQNLDVIPVSGVEIDYDSRNFGDNAVIDAQVEFEQGYISEVAIYNSGFAYVDGDPGTLNNPVTDQVLASGTIQARTEGKNKGYWKDYSSHLNGYITDPANNEVIDSYYSSGMRIQDSDFYQEFSYQIKSTLDKGRYEKLLKENVHLAGTKMFGDFIFKAEIPSSTKPRFVRLFNDDGSGSPLDQANVATLEASVTNFTVDSTYVTADHEPV